tara:strand:- start:1647 stop:2261 length:615 start_codon:yes stop_codon:yes gene_type:complete
MAFKMKDKSMTQGTSAYKKALVGKQGNLPEGLKSKIEASPTKHKSDNEHFHGGDMKRKPDIPVPVAKPKRVREPEPKKKSISTQTINKRTKKKSQEVPSKPETVKPQRSEARTERDKKREVLADIAKVNKTNPTKAPKHTTKPSYIKKGKSEFQQDKDAVVRKAKDLANTYKKINPTYRVAKTITNKLVKAKKRLNTYFGNYED